MSVLTIKPLPPVSISRKRQVGRGWLLWHRAGNASVVLNWPPGSLYLQYNLTVQHEIGRYRIEVGYVASRTLTQSSTTRTP